MTGWQWFWTLVGFLIFIIVLIFLYFYQPFEDLFRIVVYGLSYANSIIWVTVIIAIIGICLFFWRAYQVYVVQQHNIEAMVLNSLKGLTFTAIMLSGGFTLQAVQLICVYMLKDDFTIDAEFGNRLVAIIALVILTGIFCIIYWLLKVIRPARRTEG